MISTEPKVQESGLYGAGEAAKMLGIVPSTLYKYTEMGYCKASRRRCSGRLVWRGSEIIKLWRYVY